MSTTQEQLATDFDKLLLDQMRKSAKGGNAVEFSKIAAVVRARLKDCGMTAVQKKGSALDEMKEEMEKRGMKFKGKPIPPLDTENRDAATGTKG